MNITKLMTLAVVALGSVACGDDDPKNDEPSDCALRVGTYSSVFAVRSGNCGAIPEQLETIDEQPTEPPAPCTGTIDYSTDNCEVTSEATCPAETLGAGWTTTTELKANWNESGSHGTAITQFVVYDDAGAVVCQGTYDVAITQL